jgi:hypothetical protein
LPVIVTYEAPLSVYSVLDYLFKPGYGAAAIMSAASAGGSASAVTAP